MVKLVIMIQVSAPLSKKEERVKYIVTVRNSSCGKVLFSQASVCSQGGCIPVRACVCVCACPTMYGVGGVCLREVSAWGISGQGVSAGGCLAREDVYPGGVWPEGCLPGRVYTP